MISTEMLQAEMQIAMAIDATDVLLPHMPIKDFLQEAGDLIEVCKADLDELQKVNINVETISRLEPAIELLRDYQTQWMDERKDMEEAREEWNKIYPEALSLKKDLLETMRFVFRDNAQQQSRISEITAGRDYADTIQDLHDLAYMGKKDIRPFNAINYDISLFDQADAMSNELMLLLGRMNGNADDDSQIKFLRDKAYTNLKTIVDYARRYGKYVFRNDPERSANYARAY